MVKKTFCTVFFACVALCLSAQQSWRERTVHALDTLCCDTLLNTSQLGLAVWDLTDDTLVYSVGYRQRMRPASCQKIVTAVAALRCLGAEHRFTPYVREPGWGWCWDDDITQGGRKRPRLTNPSQPLLNESEERTLAEVLVPMLKESDNLLAESVFQQLAYKSGRIDAGRKEAALEIERVMHDLSLNPKDYLIADGSGLSLYDYVTPELLVLFLRYAWLWDHIREPFVASLPIAGIDGTLEKRMTGTTAQGNVCAKTGTVEGISSLAGYCRSSEGHDLCFAIINQGVVRARSGRNFQDRACLILTAEPPSDTDNNVRAEGMSK